MFSRKWVFLVHHQSPFLELCWHTGGCVNYIKGTRDYGNMLMTQQSSDTADIFDIFRQYMSVTWRFKMRRILKCLFKSRSVKKKKPCGVIYSFWTIHLFIYFVHVTTFATVLRWTTWRWTKGRCLVCEFIFLFTLRDSSTLTPSASINTAKYGGESLCICWMFACAIPRWIYFPHTPFFYSHV